MSLSIFERITSSLCGSKRTRARIIIKNRVSREGKGHPNLNEWDWIRERFLYHTRLIDSSRETAVGIQETSPAWMLLSDPIQKLSPWAAYFPRNPTMFEVFLRQCRKRSKPESNSKQLTLHTHSEYIFNDMNASKQGKCTTNRTRIPNAEELTLQPASP